MRRKALQGYGRWRTRVHFISGCILSRAVELDPADILSPGITAKIAAGRINHHLAVAGIEIDPARVTAPGVAKQCAGCIVEVDAIIPGAGVGIIGVTIRSAPEKQDYCIHEDGRTPENF